MEAQKESPVVGALGSEKQQNKTTCNDNFSHEELKSNGMGTLDLLAFATEAVALGFSVLPTVPGKKCPGSHAQEMKWGPYQERLPTLAELKKWFSPAQEGVGVVTGAVSGVEFFDFDSHLARDFFFELVERAGHGDLLRRMTDGYQDESPNGGHVPYRCSEVADSQKLAKVYARDENGEFLLNEKGERIEKTLIETKGNGGFIIIPPSHGKTHPSGKPYKQVSGGLASIATITPEEREALFAVARTMNEVFSESKGEKSERAVLKKSSASGRPGDLYNADEAVTWASVLEPHGWQQGGIHNGVVHWTRPGKEQGTSATTGYAGTDYLYVFSTSTALEAERGYSKFSAFTYLNYRGDFQAAADELMQQGYFPRSEEPPIPEEEEEENARMLTLERDPEEDEELPEGAEGFSEEEEQRAENEEIDSLPPQSEAPQPEARFTRPKIRITTRMTQVVNEAERALLRLPNGPHLFQRIDQLCFVTHSAIPPKFLKRSLGAPSIVSCSTDQLRERMSLAAEWWKLVERKKEWTLALPPEWAVKTLHGRRNWQFPVLADVISAPTLRADGEIISAPGYDPDTGLFLDTQGVLFPPIPTQPTLDDAVRAVAALKEPFTDFPFARPDGMSAALAAILSLVVRPAIDGCVPLFAVDSTTRGTGKGLLIDCVTVTATGYPAPRWAQTQDVEEDRKALLTIGMEGDRCCHIDNLTYPLGSGPLDLALTTGFIKGRLLGLNKSATAPMTCVFFASGNNISYAGDMARRVVPIHLESLLERPEERDDFQQPRLLEWVRKERARLIVEALTLLRAYFVAGCPKQSISAYGAFQEWSDLVRSALVWAGCPDPCEGRKDIEAEADTGYENLARLLHCWAACYESQAVTLSSVIGDVGLRSAETASNEWNELSEALAAFDSRYDGKKLDVRRIGKALRAVKKRVIDGLRLIQAGEYQHALLWKVQKV